MTQHTSTVEAGDVFVSRWGYEQTNVDFYEVVGVTPSTVRLQPIASRVVENDAARMTTKVVPTPGEHTGPVFRRKVHHFEGDVLVRVNTCAIAKPWDGRQQRASHYA